MVSGDNEDMGVQGANYIVDKIGTEGTVVMLEVPTSGSVSELRKKGFVVEGFAESLPATILCRDDCAGLCPTCGANRNTTSCDCAQTDSDSRWDRLREIAERMGLEGEGGAGTPS